MDPNWVSRKIAEFYQAPDKNKWDARAETERRFPSDGRLSLIHNWQKRSLLKVAPAGSLNRLSGAIVRRTPHRAGNREGPGRGGEPDAVPRPACDAEGLGPRSPEAYGLCKSLGTSAPGLRASVAWERPARPVFIAPPVNSQGRTEFSAAATCRFPGWNRVGGFATDFASKTLLRDGNQPPN